MSSYNLNDNVNENFGFEVGGHSYLMRYPSVEEIEGLQKVIKESENDTEKILDYVYAFVSADEGTPPLKDVMRKQNVKVMVNFTNMIKSEFVGE